MVRTGLSCALVLLLVIPLAGARSEEPLAAREVAVLQKTFETAIHAAEPAIVGIIVSRSNAYQRLTPDPLADQYSGRLGTYDPADVGRRFGNLNSGDLQKLDLASKDHVPESYGSGIVIDAKGLILTNRHVVHEATKIYVRLKDDKGSYADIHADDPRSDLAVLRLLNPPAHLPTLKLGDGLNVRKGQIVFTLGNPFAAGFADWSPSASWGIISNVRRRAPGRLAENDEQSRSIHQYGTLLQADARLNLGCSGGALIDLKGELIGITSALAAISGSETSGGYAIPMDPGIRRIIEVLRAGKEVEYGFLGVSLAPPSGGALIDKVSPNSPAERAKLRPNDLIIAVNDQPIRSNDDLFLALGTLLAGSEARLEVRSASGATRQAVAVLAKYYVPARSIALNQPAAVRGLRVDHGSILAQVQVIPARALPQGIPNGVVVREVVPDSPADKASLRVNEVITHVNGEPVLTPAEFYEKAQKVRTGPLRLRLLDADREIEIH